MLLGAEYINARVTPLYCDFDKRDKCLAVEKFYKKFHIVQINNVYSGVDIIFYDEDNDDLFTVKGFPRRMNENCYEYIERLSFEISSDMRIVKIWKEFPRFVAVILNLFFNNKRIFQYIDKSNKVYELSSRGIDLYDFD